MGGRLVYEYGLFDTHFIIGAFFIALHSAFIIISFLKVRKYIHYDIWFAVLVPNIYIIPTLG